VREKQEAFEFGRSVQHRGLGEAAKTRAVRIVHLLGRVAFLQGVRQEACPFGFEGRREAWLNGWQYEQREELFELEHAKRRRRRQGRKGTTRPGEALQAGEGDSDPAQAPQNVATPHPGGQGAGKGVTRAESTAPQR
jgi:ribosome modulation factor